MSMFHKKHDANRVYKAEFITDSQFDADFGAVIEIGREEQIEEYEGTYVVEPIFESQTLETSGKKMADDLTVNEIAVRTVQNLSGGMTVTIGG